MNLQEAINKNYEKEFGKAPKLSLKNFPSIKVDFEGGLNQINVHLQFFKNQLRVYDPQLSPETEFLIAKFVRLNEEIARDVDSCTGVSYAFLEEVYKKELSRKGYIIDEINNSVFKEDKH